MMLPATQLFRAQNIVYALKSAQLPAESVRTNVACLPMRKDDAWTMNVLVKPERAPENRTVIAGFGRASERAPEGAGRFFSVSDDSLNFWSARRGVQTGSPLEEGRWQMLTATYDGTTLRLYKDGDPIGSEDIELSDDREASVVIGAPEPSRRRPSFQGAVQSFTIRLGALNGEEVKQLFAKTKPDK